MKRLGRSTSDITGVLDNKVSLSGKTGIRSKIYLNDGSYIWTAKQKDIDDFICIYVEKKDKYLVECKLIRYDI
jgi:hypothetical protein